MMTSAAKAISAVKQMSKCCDMKICSPSHLLVSSPERAPFDISMLTGDISSESSQLLEKKNDRLAILREAAVNEFSGQVSGETALTPSNGGVVLSDQAFHRRVMLSSVACPGDTVSRNLSQLRKCDDKCTSNRDDFADYSQRESQSKSHNMLTQSTHNSLVVTDLCDLFPSSLLLMQHMCYHPFAKHSRYISNRLWICW
jgi:hypothetical protein